MTFVEVIAALILAVSLCADCFAVCVCSSVTLKKIEWRNVSIIALVFGFVQAGLLLAGYLFGDLFVGYIEKIAHWIGFLLLLYVGGSMVLEALRKESEVRNLNGFTNVILGALATSIDALVVGISLSMGQLELHDIILNTAAVFLLTFLSVVVGMFFGHKVGHRLGKIAELIGGIVLILIGLNILLEFV